MYTELAKFESYIHVDETDNEHLEKLNENVKSEKIYTNTCENKNAINNPNTLTARQNNIVIIISLLSLILGVYNSLSSSIQLKQQHTELIETIQEIGYPMTRAIQELTDALNREHP